MKAPFHLTKSHFEGFIPNSPKQSGVGAETTELYGTLSSSLSLWCLDSSTTRKDEPGRLCGPSFALTNAESPSWLLSR